MNDRFDLDDSSIDLDTFREWVERTADREGTSSDAILQQLMSTYWILNELTETLEETPYQNLLDRGADDDSEARVDDPGPEETTEAVRSEIVDVIEAISELNDQPRAPDPDPNESSIDPKLIEVIEALQQQSQPQQQDGFDPSIFHVTNQLERLREQVSSLDETVEEAEDRVEALREETGAEFADLRAWIDDVEGTADELDDRVESVSHRHEAELTDLAESIDRLEKALARKPDHEAHAELESRVDERHGRTQDRIDTFEETFEESYADIKRILTYLLDTSNEHSVSLDVLVDTFESDLDAIVSAHEDARRLREVKAAANKDGITTAVCDECDEPFDVALLAEPRCPHCQRDIARFEPESFLWRTTHVAKTRQYQPTDDDQSLRERIEDAQGEIESPHESSPRDLSMSHNDD